MLSCFRTHITSYNHAYIILKIEWNSLIRLPACLHPKRVKLTSPDSAECDYEFWYFSDNCKNHDIIIYYVLKTFFYRCKNTISST